MRNKTLFPVLSALVLLSTWGCSNNNVSLEGNVEGSEEGVLVLKRLDINRTSFVDSLEIDNNGNFHFRTHLEAPELFLLSNEEGRMINLLLAPGDEIGLQTTSDSFDRGYLVQGSEESTNIRQLVERLQSTKDHLDSLSNEAAGLDNPQSEEMTSIRRAYAQELIDQKRFTIRYLMEHPGELSSVYALYQEYKEGVPVMGDELDIQYFKHVSDSVSQAHPASSLAISLQTDIEQRELLQKQVRQLDQIMALADTNEVSIVELEIPDKDGNPVALSSLKGKVVLVSFWASWNENSMNMLMGLKKTYEKYHRRGFEVYAISLDPDKARWMDAVDFNEFDWINVCELNYPESKAAAFYNVSNIPTTFLVNREGEIMKRNLSGKQLETWLDNLL